MGKRELVPLPSLSLVMVVCLFWRLVMVVWLFLTVPWICLRFAIMVIPDHNHLLFLFKLYPWGQKNVPAPWGQMFNIGKT